MEFQIQIRDCIAETLSVDGTIPQLVCDNTDHIVRFQFDEAWDAYTEKTARFVYREDYGNGDVVCKDVKFSGDTVVVPLLHHIREVWIGVIAGALRTTTAARISCLSSIYSHVGKEEQAILPLSSYIVQGTGDSPDKIMSQKAVTEALLGIAALQKASGERIVFPTEGWEAGAYIHVPCEAVHADSIVLIDPTPECVEAYCEAEILCVAQEEGSLTFRCASAPTREIEVQVVIL